MYMNENGYPETFDVSHSAIKTIENKAAAIQRRLDHLKGISLPFANCTVTNCSISAGGGWSEVHPPICPEVVKAHEADLEAYKNAERVRILKELSQGLVLVVG